MYIARVPPRIRRGLGRLGSQAMPLSLATATSTPSPTGYYPPVLPDATSCSYWDFFFNPTAWSACAQAAEVANINQVAVNAAAVYGSGSPSDLTAQAAAAQQETYAADDTSNIARYYGAGNLVTSASIPTWLYVAGGVAGGLLLISALK